MVVIWEGLSSWLAGDHLLAVCSHARSARHSLSFVHAQRERVSSLESLLKGTLVLANPTLIILFNLNYFHTGPNHIVALGKKGSTYKLGADNNLVHIIIK